MWTPRQDWEDGARESFLEETIDVFTFMGDSPEDEPSSVTPNATVDVDDDGGVGGFSPDYLMAAPYQNPEHMHAGRFFGGGRGGGFVRSGGRMHGDDLENEP
jgi:hypothetical protein